MGFLVCLVVPGTGEYSVLQWSSRRQTITAYSALEAEIVAMSEGVMTSLLMYDAAELNTSQCNRVLRLRCLDSRDSNHDPHGSNRNPCDSNR